MNVKESIAFAMQTDDLRAQQYKVVAWFVALDNCVDPVLLLSPQMLRPRSVSVQLVEGIIY
jgi:hypothetical protein